MRRLILALALAVLAGGCVFGRSTDISPLTQAVDELMETGFHARRTSVAERGGGAPEERTIDFVPPDALKVDARSSGVAIIIGRRVYSSVPAGFTCTSAPSGFDAPSVARQLVASVRVARKAKKTDTGFTYVFESDDREGSGTATLRDGRLVRLATKLDKGKPTEEFPVSLDVRFSRHGEPPAVNAPRNLVRAC